MRNIYNTF